MISQASVLKCKNWAERTHSPHKIFGFMKFLCCLLIYFWFTALNWFMSSATNFILNSFNVFSWNHKSQSSTKQTTCHNRLAIHRSQPDLSCFKGVTRYFLLTNNPFTTLLSVSVPWLNPLTPISCLYVSISKIFKMLPLYHALWDTRWDSPALFKCQSIKNRYDVMIVCLTLFEHKQI